MQTHLLIYNIPTEITVAGAWKETLEKENHAQTTTIEFQPEKNPLLVLD